jgi:hypothetical protein
MRKSSKYIVSLLMALWLPINGYGALNMPYCQHGSAGMSVGAAMPGGDHSGMPHHADADSRAAHHGESAGATCEAESALECNNCGVCHLACSPLLMSESIMFKPIGQNVFDVQVQPSLLSFSPEQPQRPPKAAL